MNRLVSMTRDRVLFVQNEVLKKLSSNRSSVLHAAETLRPQVDVSFPLDERYQSGSVRHQMNISNCLPPDQSEMSAESRMSRMGPVQRKSKLK